jgi:purine-binding chemotaxis protein CheW
MSQRGSHACSFSLDGRLYGFDLAMVREVHPYSPWVPAPLAPRGIHGLVNLRGRIHLILNIRALLGLPDKASSESDLLILFNETAGPSFGVVVDAIGGILPLAGPSLPSPGPLVASATAAKDEILTLVRAEDLISAVSKRDLDGGEKS